MTCDIPKYGTPAIVVIVAIVSILSIGTASAGPCAREIAEFENALPLDENGVPMFVGTAPQSIGAQLEHQPTPISVERAKREAQSQIFKALAQAQALDLQGRPSECRDAIARAKILLNP
jgi:hypothetical protein